jgi:hypothetical protein
LDSQNQTENDGSQSLPVVFLLCYLQGSEASLAQVVNLWSRKPIKTRVGSKMVNNPAKQPVDKLQTTSRRRLGSGKKSFSGRWFAMTLFLSLLTSCAPQGTAPAEKRPDSAPAIVFEQNAKQSESLSTNSEPTSVLAKILRPDMFAAISIHVPEIRQAPELQEVPWSELESSWQKWLGLPAVSFESIDQWWVLFDRNAFSLLPTTEGGADSPLIQVIQFRDPISWEQLSNNWTRDSAAPAGTPETPTMFHRQNEGILKLDDRTLVWGPHELLAKFQQSSGTSPLLTYWQATDAAKTTVVGRVEISAIRSQLKTITDMLSQFDASGPWSRLPDGLTGIQVQAQLQQDPLIAVEITFTDDKLQREIGQKLAQVTESNAAASPLPLGSLLPTATDDALFKPVSSDAWNKIRGELQQPGMITVESQGSRLVMNLKRPASFSTAVSLSIVDAIKQYDVATRLEQANRIGEAWRTYLDRHGKFPSSVAVNASDQSPQSPGQFSWRVALLPSLGYQELYDRFDFTQPWDSPHNLEIARQIPESFPLAGTDGRSHWILANCDAALYGPARTQPSLADVSDRKIWTAAVLESTADRQIFWTDPHEPETNLENSSIEWGRADEFGVMMITVDGQTRIVRKNQTALKAVLTRSGGETLSRKDFFPIQDNQRRGSEAETP